MSIFAWIVVGLIAGALANLVYPAPSRGGWLGALVLGIVGALFGGFIVSLVTGQDLVTGFNLVTILVATLGALALLVGYNGLTRSRSRTW